MSGFNRAQRRHPDHKTFSPARRRYCTINQAADYLDVTERTVRQMITDGRLVGYRMGARFIRLDLDEIDAAFTPFGGAV
jgi:excisionase family DNA binding protein